MRYVALYARTSTQMQSTGLDAQVLALKTYCESMGVTNYKIFTDEGVSGARAHRPGLDSLMDAARSGSISSVIVYSFSRFARSVSHLLSALETFQALEISFVSVSERIDTNTPMGKMVFTVCGAVAELDRQLIVERVKCGLINAKACGKRLGRPKTRNEDLIANLRQKGFTHRQIATLAKCSTWSVCQTLKRLGIENFQSEDEPVRQVG